MFGGMTRRSMPAAAGLLAVVAAGACAPGPADAGSVQVVAAVYPLEYLAEQVGGGHVAVTGLTPPGVEAHDLELTPSQVAGIARADLVVHLAGFQPVVDEAIAAHATGAVVDVSTLVPLLDLAGQPADDHDRQGTGGDPHLWLDPDRMAVIAGGLATTLGTVDVDHATDYPTRADDLAGRLAMLDAEYADGLADCQRRELVVSHASFGYLAQRYGLHQIPVTGLSPEAQPGPQRLAEVIAEARDHGATTIFYDPLTGPDIAQVIADETGAGTAVLDPIEGLTPGGGKDYFSLMRENLDALRTGLGCT
jgi:zinc transport system substrate-binding protein